MKSPGKSYKFNHWYINQAILSYIYFKWRTKVRVITMKKLSSSNTKFLSSI